MAESAYYNSNYHVFRKENNPNRLLASFSLYKLLNGANIFPYDHRPPYPILNQKPTTADILNNINRSDLALYAAHLALGKIK